MFELRHDSENDMLETYPQPSKESLPKYYKSEDYISHTDTKRNLFEWAYHLVRKTTLKSKLSLLETFNIDAKNLLDVGCGTGDFLLAAKNNDWNISGVEPDEKAREIANEKTNNSVYGIEKLLNFDKHSFDVITLWHVLEHLPELEENISVFKSLLKPNGRLVIAVPNFKSYDAIFYKENWAAFDAPRHLWHFSQTSIKKMFGKIKMEIEQT
ncbi:MAG: class I SAM-dependent methyltransferase, partial [Bacteroidia bacterium]|nr:class I SAM-dependent methyltransferase [Bacteroidia bacterium]NNK28583.1 class I SAM-dependent methyltransferase [Flavobacteriaceae bacterium]